MRSLSTKLTLTIGGVAIVAMLLMLLIVTYSTFNGFDEFIADLIPVTPNQLIPPPPQGGQDNDRDNNQSSRRDKSDTPAGDFEDSVYQGVVIGLGGGVLLALGVGGVLARQLIRPIHKLTTAAQTLADGQLGYQVPVTTEDEIGELTRAFNQMSQDLAHSEHLRQQMTADIAHDIRTPLTVIAGYTEGLSHGKTKGSPQTYRVMHQQVEQLQRLLEDLRTLSLCSSARPCPICHRQPQRASPSPFQAIPIYRWFP